MNILETRGLYHDFEGLKVLFDVNLQVEEGERHAIIGPNGAGKTTLFNLITGVYTPSKGKVSLNGKDITGKDPYEILRLGLGRSFQITNIFNEMTTFENLRLAVLSKRGIRYNLVRKIKKMREITEETDGILKWVGLDEERDILAGNLSYGKQRTLEISL
ncbi:MAG: ATP-binding cassette domain-containing protein, partial [Deltaproteobacteria bacterium]|nr:ATP-binding cassette domain-containing protein [Deltaproteobacteria bacterium]